MPPFYPLVITLISSFPEILRVRAGFLTDKDIFIFNEPIKNQMEKFKLVALTGDDKDTNQIPTAPPTSSAGIFFNF